MTPWSFRKSPQALHSGWPSELRRHSGVVCVVQFVHVTGLFLLLVRATATSGGPATELLWELGAVGGEDCLLDVLKEYSEAAALGLCGGTGSGVGARSSMPSPGVS